jgi:hypothetical protein
VSIAEFENSYLHPAFLNSPTGFLLTNIFGVTTFNGVNVVNTILDGNSTVSNNYLEPSDWYTRIKNTIIGSSERIVPYNIHAKCAIQLLALIELGVTNLHSVPLVYRGIGHINCGANNKYSMLSHNFSGYVKNDLNGECYINCLFNIPSAYNPENIISFVAVGDKYFADYKYAGGIHSGYNSQLLAHAELYNIPAYYKVAPESVWHSYYSRVNVNGQEEYDLSHRGGELSITTIVGQVDNDYTFGVNARYCGADKRVYARGLILD